MSRNRNQSSQTHAERMQALAEQEEPSDATVITDDGDAITVADMAERMTENVDAAGIVAEAHEATDDEAPTGEQPTETPDPIQALRDAVTVALATGDPITGTLPAVATDALGSAWRAIPKPKRDAAVADVTAEAMSACMADPTAMSGMTLVGAVMLALSAVKQASTVKPAKPGRVTVAADPVADAVAALVSLSVARGAVLATLSDEQVVTALVRADAIASGTDAIPESVSMARVAQVYGIVAGKRASKRSGGTPREPRAPGSGRTDLPPLIAAWLDVNGPATYGAIKRGANLSSGGAVQNALRDGRVAGWKLSADGKRAERVAVTVAA